MATIKSYTDLEQSKKLAKILPLESADMYYWLAWSGGVYTPKVGTPNEDAIKPYWCPCWSLASLLDVLSEIKPQVYIPILFPSEGKWILQFAEYGHGNVCEVTCDNPVDACVEIIIKLSKLKLL